MSWIPIEGNTFKNTSNNLSQTLDATSLMNRAYVPKDDDDELDMLVDDILNNKS